jgi:hypothetical protein
MDFAIRSRLNHRGQMNANVGVITAASGGRKSPVSGIESQAVTGEEQWADAHRSPKDA